MLLGSDKPPPTPRHASGPAVKAVLYSARREETIRRTQWLQTTTPPWMNVEGWAYQGRGADEAKTKKRRPPAKAANRLRRRWRVIDFWRSAELRTAGIFRDGEKIRFVVNRTHDGGPLSGKIALLGKAFLKMLAWAKTWCGIRSAIPRTWLMQLGTDRWEAAGWLGMTLEQLENGYGHHHPDFQEEAAVAFGGRR
jgi:hypothetical protein